MYVGIDIGGTKTLVAVLDENGVIIEKVKFPTSRYYDTFLKNLQQSVKSIHSKDFIAGGLGLPTTKLDRKHGRAIRFGNLPWKNIPIQDDVEKIFLCPMIIENDAKLGALSESMLLKDKYSSVLYVTISTGIGYGLVVDHAIDKDIGAGGGRTILLEHKGKIMPWEDFASGRAIVERFGKQARDIHDEETWKIISRDLAKGFIQLIAIMQPEVIVIGGGVGNYFDRFNRYLEKDIERYKIPLVQLPILQKAQRPDDAVIYGCYDIAKQHYNHADNHN